MIIRITLENRDIFSVFTKLTHANIGVLWLLFHALRKNLSQKTVTLSQANIELNDTPQADMFTRVFDRTPQ